MLKRAATTSIPLWMALVIITGTTITLLAVVARFQEKIYNRDITLTGAMGNREKLEYGSWPALANADFFQGVKQQFITDQVNFIEADLSRMKLRVYQEGIVVKEVSILSKGQEGSWWETPAGIYQIQNKEVNHFSSFGGVYMPWSMPFQGNFFIHGWPHYEDGTPVHQGYSGGCIRLATEDSREVFNLTKVGTPVLVFENDFLSDGFTYHVKEPETSSNNYLIADLASNSVIAKNASTDQPVPIASLTKLMTALIATEYINLDKQITITKDAIVYTSRPRLVVGEKIAAFQLLYPLLLESSNEAAFALAHSLGKNQFIDLMNEKAQALGMENTKFVDPTGASEQNVSTTEDLFLLAKYLYNNRSFILKMTKGELTYSAYGPSTFKKIKNFNVFEKYPGFVGGKVGQTTEAKETILSIFKIGVGEAERPIVVIVLGSQDNGTDTEVLLKHLQETYE